jgi:CheY-like chemotaxis protein
MKRRVLVVEGDAAIREAMKRLLESAGYAVGLAQEGEAAAVNYLPAQTDLLILDLNLSRRSGWDVFERLTTRYPRVPVIMITGMPNQYPAAMAAGASALLEKPIEPTAFLQTIGEVLAEPIEKRLSRRCGGRGEIPGNRGPRIKAIWICQAYSNESQRNLHPIIPLRDG